MILGPVFLGLYVSQISSVTNAVIISTALFLAEVSWHLLKAAARN